tara:strand:- start:754 stop:1002 length:249 start_codon:yes stop_codon:yes gene_type:complete
MTEFSKKFLAKSPFKTGIGGVIRVMPRGSLGNITGQNQGSIGKEDYDYSFKDMKRDKESGVSKKDIIKKRFESMIRGKKLYL